MALFGKKTTTNEAPPQEEVATFTDDFSPEALEALAESLDSGETGVQDGSALQARKPVSFKNGSVLGINIGADSMKAVELTAKGGSCTVTGLAIAPTPPDCIANGVVMSVNVLADAVKELIAPFKSRKVVTSVAGTGEVIVRVIEVPTMTDAELQENMKTDLDRYIPFPPSEVQWDAAAMRDLPMDPNSPNMDVLLVAARHELIELHLQLLDAIKVDPKAIDVEPLAAARALSGPFSENKTHVDYDDVCAILDIGASSTEISILRGDELVFTRTVPAAGNSMTQALADQLNLPHLDAERLKREKGDAFPEQEAPQAEATPLVTTEVATVNENADVAGEDVADAADQTGVEEAAPVAETLADAPTDGSTETGDASTDAPAEDADPFDLDLFNAGPTQDEPGEQHQQKMPSVFDDDDLSQLPTKVPTDNSQENEDTDSPDDDADDADSTQNEPDEQHQQKMPNAPSDDDDLSQLPAKTPSDNPQEDADMGDDDSSLPSKGGETDTDADDAPPAASGAIASFFDFDESELDEESEELPTIEGKPQNTEAPPIDEDEPGTIDWDDDSFLPSVAATEASEETLPSAFTFPDEESPSPIPTKRAEPADGAVTAPPVTQPSTGFSLDRIDEPKPTVESKDTLPPVLSASAAATAADASVAAAASVAAESVAPPPPPPPVEAVPEEDIDLSDILGDSSQDTPAVDIDEGLGGTISLDETDGLGADLDVEEKPHDEAAVNVILKPILDDLTSELRRSLEYHSARYPDAPVKRLMLIGGGAKMRNLDAYFAQSLGLPTNVGDPFKNLDTDAPQVNSQLASEHGSSFAVALGLAMREIIR